MGKAGDFIQECKRVFRITKKPTGEEYKNIALVAALGILVIGFIGALMHILKDDSVLGVSLTVGIAMIVILVLMFMKSK